MFATVTSVDQKLLPTTYVSTSVNLSVRVPSAPVTIVVMRYGLAAVPEPVSVWLTGVNGISVLAKLPVVWVPPAWFAKSGPRKPEFPSAGALMNRNVPQSPGPFAFGKNSVLENPPLRTWQLRSLPM